MRRLLLLSCLLALGCVGPGGVAEQSSSIVGGTTDTGDPAVMLLIVGDINSGYVALCTCELISPHVLLTAAHCTNEKGPYHVYRGNDINRLSPSDLLTGTAHPHPMYTGNTRNDNYDIGVVVLDDPITDVMPVPINRNVDPNTLVGQSVRFVGYGTTGGITSSDTTSGIKRQTSTTLSAVQTRMLEFDDGQHMTCEGDSGGPAFMMIDGQETVVGVTAVGGATQTMCYGGGLDTRVDLYVNDFIQPFLDQYDPKPVTGPDGKPAPGAVGAACSDPSECNSGMCVNAPNGYCTASCDPNQGDAACANGLQCNPIDPNDTSVGFDCQQKKRANGGCDVSGSSRETAPWALFGLALAALALRRRRQVQ